MTINLALTAIATVSINASAIWILAPTPTLTFVNVLAFFTILF